MAYLVLSLYQHPSGASFNPEAVIEKAKAFFPEATFVPGDRSTAEVQFAESFFARELQAKPEGSARKVVESLRRKAKTYGPTYAFRIPVAEGGEIRGLARRVTVEFLFDDSLPEPMRRRLLAFLRSLGAGRLQASTREKNQIEILWDLGGQSDCTLPSQEVQ
jgi:hypothetical protein